MTIPFSIVYELPKSCWGAGDVPNKIPHNWLAILNSMRSLWKSGVDTSLETAFYNPFPGKGYNLPDWMSK